MNAPSGRFVDRETRYKLIAARAVRIAVQSEGTTSDEPLNAELIDISAGGLRICSAAAVAEGDRLAIAVTSEDQAGPIAVRAEVCWTSLASKGRLYAGCSIEPPIPQAVLDDLAAAGILERRQEVRQETTLAMPARWELDRIACEASLLNISSGGISLLMPQAGSVGRRICLMVPGENQPPAQVYVKALWQIGTPAGVVVGCEVRDRAVYQRLSQAVCALV